MSDQAPSETLRETWVDLENGRCTRRPSTLEAWRQQGLGLQPTSHPVEIDAGRPMDTALWVPCITPEWLGSPDGTLSYSELAFRGYERELYLEQRDHALESYISVTQPTLTGWQADA